MNKKTKIAAAALISFLANILLSNMGTVFENSNEKDRAVFSKGNQLSAKLVNMTVF